MARSAVGPVSASQPLLHNGRACAAPHSPRHRHGKPHIHPKRHSQVGSLDSRLHLHRIKRLPATSSWACQKTTHLLSMAQCGKSWQVLKCTPWFPMSCPSTTWILRSHYYVPRWGNAAPTCRIRHSPGAVQGRDALEEICDPPEPEPSRLELLALDAGIRCSPCWNRAQRLLCQGAVHLTCSSEVCWIQ